MLLKKIIGLIIITLNAAGIGFVIYLVVAGFQNKSSDQTLAAKKKPVSGKDNVIKTSPRTKNNLKNGLKNKNIIPEEDDLLKDMDLSDLDNINLDDFD